MISVIFSLYVTLYPTGTGTGGSQVNTICEAVGFTLNFGGGGFSFIFTFPLSVNVFSEPAPNSLLSSPIGGFFIGILIGGRLNGSPFSPPGSPITVSLPG